MVGTIIVDVVEEVMVGTMIVDAAVAIVATNAVGVVGTADGVMVTVWVHSFMILNISNYDLISTFIERWKVG